MGGGNQLSQSGVQIYVEQRGGGDLAKLTIFRYWGDHLAKLIIFRYLEGCNWQFNCLPYQLSVESILSAQWRTEDLAKWSP